LAWPPALARASRPATTRAGPAVAAPAPTLAAAGPFSMNHYMGKVAQVHARLRGWQAAPSP
jgi:hypothetical protein